MSPRTTATTGLEMCSKLPNELLVEIIYHLDHDDLLRLINVNTHFRSLVREVAKEWAHEHATITELSAPRFPLAEDPFKFGKKGRKKLKKLLRDSFKPDTEKAAIAEELRRIDIKPHPYAQCLKFEESEIGSRDDLTDPPCYFLNLDVLNIQLYFPNHGQVHGDPRLWHHTGLPKDNEECLYLTSILVSHNVDKIVMKDIPRFRRPSTAFAEWSGEFVSVLFSQQSVPAETNYRTCTYSHDLGFHMLDMSVVTWAEKVVLVFWTERPGQVWIPPCRHTRHRDRVWSRLAQAVFNYGVYHLTVVNAGAVLPSGVSLENHENSLGQEAETARPAAQDEPYAAFHRTASQFSEDLFYCKYRFITMEEWIQEDTWEDAFSAAEMEPWLRSM